MPPNPLTEVNTRKVWTLAGLGGMTGVALGNGGALSRFFIQCASDAKQSKSRGKGYIWSRLAYPGRVYG